MSVQPTDEAGSQTEDVQDPLNYAKTVHHDKHTHKHTNKMIAQILDVLTSKVVRKQFPQQCETYPAGNMVRRYPPVCI